MATERRAIYKCLVCGIVAEVLDGGAGEPVCCGEPMALQAPKTADTGKEKHVPVIEYTEHDVKIDVGAVPHPMEKDHYIQWIEVFHDGVSCRKFLKPGDAPQARFDVKGARVVAREFCNKHGLWTA